MTNWEDELATGAPNDCARKVHDYRLKQFTQRGGGMLLPPGKTHNLTVKGPVPAEP
jgi:hypothetical protein